jgi:1-acyl-sn-glycerol-3-phosphate acyltransferase
VAVVSNPGSGGEGGSSRHDGPPPVRARPAAVTVRFGAPLHFDRWRGMAGSAPALRAVTDEIIDAIGELSGQERVPRYHELPDEIPRIPS